MVEIGCLLWALFIIILGFSMFPSYMTFVVVISFIGGLIDGILKIRKKKEKEEMERRKRESKYKEPKDDFDIV